MVLLERIARVTILVIIEYKSKLNSLLTTEFRERERERTQSWWVRDGKEGNKVGGFPFHLLGLFFFLDRGCVSACRRMREREAD